MTATSATPPPPPPQGNSRTIGARLGQRDNALNFVRLLLAVTVIVGHAWPLGGYGNMPGIGRTPIGEIAVGGFFAASGFLIAGSRSRLSFLPYLWRRALRIYPAFWVSLVVVAFVAAPLSTQWQGTWAVNDGWRHVLGNASLHIADFRVGGTIPDVPFGPAWNGSLWTLIFEFIAYLCLGLLFFVRSMRQPLALFALLVAGVLAQFLAQGPWTSPPTSICTC